jgi:hypothetical protein
MPGIPAELDRMPYGIFRTTVCIVRVSGRVSELSRKATSISGIGEPGGRAGSCQVARGSSRSLSANTGRGSLRNRQEEAGTDAVGPVTGPRVEERVAIGEAGVANKMDGDVTGE